MSRRRFLRTVAAATFAAPFILPSGLRAASPNGKLCHACIGVTRMGGNDLKNFQQHERVQIVALCDVDAQHLDEAAKLVPDARRYTDWRELFDKEGDKIDSVNVTVPDHMHFPIAYTAVRRGKHLYCQKPMCHDLAEVRTLTEAAVKSGIVTQLGTQFASGIGDRMTVQLIQERRDRQDQARLSLLQPRGARLPRPRAAPGARRAAAAPLELGLVDRHGADAAVSRRTPIIRRNGAAGSTSAQAGARTWAVTS